MRAFIARDLDGALYLYTSNPPIKAEEGWVPSSKLDTLSSLNWKLFPEVKWEDKEPTEINIEIVNKHQ